MMFLKTLRNFRHLKGGHWGSASQQVPHPACQPKYNWRSRAGVSHSGGHGLIESREDRYDGVIIEGKSLPADPAAFSRQLTASLQAANACSPRTCATPLVVSTSQPVPNKLLLQEWGAQNKRGIWMKLDLSQAALLPVAVQAGFDFRHAESGHMVLTKWLPTDVPNLLPEGATHQALLLPCRAVKLVFLVGVGAFVLNERKEVLLVQEGTGSQRGQNLWKLPTGLTNLGEDIPDAAAREVREETGIRAVFDSVLAVRQSHGYNFGRSDLFFVVGMRLLEGQQEIMLQRHELAAADWHSLEAAEHFPLFQSGEMFKSIFAVCKAYAAGEYKGMLGRKLENGFNPKSDLLVHGHHSDFG